MLQLRPAHPSLHRSTTTQGMNWLNNTTYHAENTFSWDITAQLFLIGNRTCSAECSQHYSLNSARFSENCMVMNKLTFVYELFMHVSWCLAPLLL